MGAVVGPADGAPVLLTVTGGALVRGDDDPAAEAAAVAGCMY